MTKPDQILIIEPFELRFRGPFSGTSVTSYLKLTNPCVRKVYFKIKTTAPKRYCVRPNAGVLKPNGVSQIAVTLQPFDFDPTEKNKHKFMVQSVIAMDDDTDGYTDVWKDVNPDQVMESKLKCVFENPVSNTSNTSTTETARPAAAAKTDTDRNQEKNTASGDSVKSSPKVLGEAEEKLMKAAQEVHQLRVEESNLRQENLQLREDLLSLRDAVFSGNNANLGVAKGLPSQSSNPLPLTSTSVLIAIVMAIVGYLLGKMF